MAMSGFAETCSTVCSAISGAKASRSAFSVRFSSAVGDDEADVVLRRRLRDEKNVGARFGGGGERAGENVGEADDAGAADGNHGDIANGGERFDTSAGGHAFGGDFCAGPFGREAVANPDGHAGGGDRAQGVRVQHFRAEVGELGGFVVGNFRDGARFGNQARVGGLHAVHVGPDDGFVRAERSAQNRGGIVGAAAA